MIFYRKFALFIFLALIMQQKSLAIENQIKIFVGREIITEQDINDKIDMIVFLNKIDRNLLASNKKILQDLATTMINEKLVAKYAKKHKIKIEDIEVKNGIATILKKSNLTEKDLINGEKNEKIKKTALEQFIKNELIMKEIVAKKIYPKIKASKFSKDLFVEKLYEKMQKNSGIYKIYQYTKTNSNDALLINKINEMEISDCDQILQIKSQFNLREIFVTNLKIGELNPQLQNILMMKNSNKGIFAYIDGNDINIIGFCQTKIDNNLALDQKKINEIYENNQLSNNISGYYRKLFNNNTILIKN